MSTINKHHYLKNLGAGCGVLLLACATVFGFLLWLDDFYTGLQTNKRQTLTNISRGIVTAKDVNEIRLHEEWIQSEITRIAEEERIAAEKAEAERLEAERIAAKKRAAEVAAQIAAGLEDPNELYWQDRTLWHCLNIMISHSDNRCAEAMLEDSPRLSRVTQMIRDLGLNNTQSNGLSSSAHDISLMLQHYYGHPEFPQLGASYIVVVMTNNTPYANIAKLGKLIEQVVLATN